MRCSVLALIEMFKNSACIVHWLLQRLSCDHAAEQLQVAELERTNASAPKADASGEVKRRFSRNTAYLEASSPLMQIQPCTG